MFSMYAHETEPELNCLQGSKWWFFVLSGVFTCIAGISAVLIWRTIVFVRFRKETASAPDDPKNQLNDEENVNRHEIRENNEKELLSEVKKWSQELLSGRTTAGKILGLVLVLSIVTFIIYLIDTKEASVEMCKRFGDHPAQLLDFAINIFFLLYFVVRFMAAPDKLLFMVNIKSFADYFTIPPFMVSIYVHRTWTGLRFLRAIHLLSIPIVLKYLNLMKNSRSLRLAEVFSISATIVLTAAGLVHLFENSGLYPETPSGYSGMSYWTYLYFVVNIMSNVGLGQSFFQTFSAQIFSCLMMLVWPVIVIILILKILFYQTRETQRSNNNCNENGQRISDDTCNTLTAQQSQSHNVVKAINYFIASNNLPLSIVEHKCFKNLIETLSPGFTIPSRSVFVTNTREMIKTDLKSVDFISASLRVWTSPDRVVSLSAFFISSEWQLECRTLLSSRKLKCNHLNADKVCRLICEMLEEFSIPMEKVSSLTTDTSSELVEGVKDLGICHIPSFTHIVNTFINEIFSLKDIVLIMEKIDKVFNELERSMEAQSDLIRAQKELNVSHNELLTYSQNRCVSKLNKMDFVRTNGMAFRNFLTTYDGGKYAHLALSSIEHQKSEFLLSLLRPIEEYTKRLTDATILTASLTNKLKRKISNSIHTAPFEEPQFKAFVAKLLSAYDSEAECHFELAEYFDPRISVDIERLESILVALKLDYRTLKRNRCGLETLFEDDDSDVDDEYQSLKGEFVLYNLQKKIPFYSNPLLWWKNKTEMFPILSQICKKYLQIQATNIAASERVFTSEALDDTRNE